MAFVEITDRAKIKQLEEAGLLWYDCLPYAPADGPADGYPKAWRMDRGAGYPLGNVEWGCKFFILIEE